MGKGGIVFYFWGADATEKGSLGPNTVVNSNQKSEKHATSNALRVTPHGIARALEEEFCSAPG